MADLPQQLQIQTQINALLSQRSKLLEANARIMTSQARLAKDLFNAMQGKELDGLEERLRKTNDGLNAAAASAKKAKDGIKDFESAVGSASKDIKKFNKNATKMGAAIGFLKGLKTGFKLLTNVTKAAFRAIGSFVKSVFKIGIAILSIPFKIFAGLVKMSQDLGSPALRQGLEKVVAAFGALSEGSGLALKNSLKGIRQEFNGLTGSSFRAGASFGRVFGYGREGMAKYLAENQELATHLGGSYASLTGILKGQYGALAIYRKGLGLTTEQQALIIKRTSESNGNIMKAQKDISTLAADVGRKFQYSAKEIGSTVGKMYEDVKTFGGFSNKQLVSMAVQTKRLGIELKELAGVSSAFGDWDKTAETVSFFARAQIANLDAMKLFRTEDPVKQIRLVQEAFKKSGTVFKNLSKEMRGETATRMGLSDQAAASVFSAKGLEMDYNEVKKATNKSAKKEISTAKVLLSLSKQIERVFGDGKHNYKGFFDALGKGFTRGVRRSTEMRKVLWNLNRSLKTVDYAGRRMGRNFVKYFPGVKKLLGALAEFFDPIKMGGAMREVNKHLITFYKTLGRTGSIEIAVTNLGSNLSGTMKRFFGDKGEVLEIIKKATEKIIVLFVKIKLILMTKAAKAAAGGLRIFSKALRLGLKKKDGGLGKAADKAGEFFAKTFGESGSKFFKTIRFDLWPAIKESAPLIFAAALRMMEMFRSFLQKREVYEKIVKGLTGAFVLVLKMKFAIIGQILKGVLTEPWAAAALVTMLFGPAIVGALATHLATAVMIPAITSARLAASAAALTSTAGAAGSMAALGGGATLMAAGKKGAMVAFGAGSKLLKFAGGVLKKFWPIALGAAVIYSVYKGVKLKGTASEKLEAGLRGFGASVIRFVSFGFVDGEKVINSMFGKQIVGPMERALYDLARSTNPAIQSMVKNAKAISKEATSYIKYAEAVEKAQKAATSLGKYIKDEDLESTYNFTKMEADAKKQQIATKREFGEGNIHNRDGVALKNLQERLTSKNVEQQVMIGHGGMMLAESQGTGQMVRHKATGRAKGTFDALLHSPARQLELLEIAEGDGPFAAAAAKLYKSAFEGKLVGTYTETEEVAVMTLVNRFVTQEANLIAAGREKIRKTGSGESIIDDILRKDGIKDKGRSKANKYLDFLRANIVDLENSGKSGKDHDAIVKQGRKRLAETSAYLQSQIFSETTKQVTESMINAEYNAIIKQTDSGKLGKVIPADLAANIKEQAKSRLARAMQTGDFGQLSSAIAIEQVTATMKAGGMSGVIKEAEMQKLGELEAAAHTVQRIKALESIPKELARLSKKMGAVPIEKVKKDAGKLVTSVTLIADAINEAAKGKLDGATTVKIDKSWETQFAAIKNIQAGAMSVVGVESIGPKLRATRIKNFEDGLTELNASFKKIAILKFDAKSAGPVIQMMSLLPTITEGIISTIPANLKTKISLAVKAVDAVNDMITKVQKVGGTKVESVVDLVEAINSGGRLVVESGSAVQVKVGVRMNVNMNELANNIVLEAIAIDDDGTSQPGYIVTKVDAP
jgi:hypothetical protein